MQPADIIKLVGLKRIIVLSSLLVIVVILSAGYFFALDPMLVEQQGKLSAVKGQISSLRGKISGIKAEIKYLKENTPVYNALLEKGIFNNQDRFETERLIENLKKHSGGLDFSFNIGDVKNLKDSNAAKIKHALVVRSINITHVGSELDFNIYKFFQEMPDIFPLFIKIKEISIKRKNKKLTQRILDEITDENTVKEDKEDKKDKKDKKSEDVKKSESIKKLKTFNLVSADITFDWVTLSKKHFKKDNGRRRRR